MEVVEVGSSSHSYLFHCLLCLFSVIVCFSNRNMFVLYICCGAGACPLCCFLSVLRISVGGFWGVEVMMTMMSVCCHHFVVQLTPRGTDLVLILLFIVWFRLVFVWFRSWRVLRV